MGKKKYYLAYGSNLNIDQMEYRCPTAKIAGYSVLKDYRLLFRGSRTGSYLTIEPCKGSKVPVGVWEIEPEDERRLDRYEGFPHFYYKRFLPVHVCSYAFDEDYEFDTDAMVYVMHEDRPLGVPTSDYLLTCHQGYVDFGFSTRYLLDAVAASRKGAKIA